MDNPGLWILGLLVALFLIFHPQARRVVAAVLAVTLVVAAALLFTKRADCIPAGGGAVSVAPQPVSTHSVSSSAPPCAMQLAPTWAGFCTPSSGAAVLKQDNHYVLVGPPGSSAFCLDMRFWKP